jgi:ABC-type Fe3+-hydroxamate transport system substrate-binding protein
VERVVALSPSAAEFALALDLDLVGRTTDTAPAVAPAAAPIGSAIAPDFAAAAKLEPDLLRADARYHSGRTRDFDRFAYPVYVFKAGTYDQVLETLQALGSATGREDKAAGAITAITARADAAKARLANRSGPPPRVLILTGGGRDVFAGGPDSYLGSLVTELGGAVVTSSGTEGGPLPGFGVGAVAESAALAPDVVLVLSSGEGGLVARILEHPAWANTPAVRRGLVIDLDTTLYLRSPGPSSGEELEGLAGILGR